MMQKNDKFKKKLKILKKIQNKFFRRLVKTTILFIKIFKNNKFKQDIPLFYIFCQTY